MNIALVFAPLALLIGMILGLWGCIWAGLLDITISYKNRNAMGRCRKCHQEIRTRRYYIGAGRIVADVHLFCRKHRP